MTRFIKAVTLDLFLDLFRYISKIMSLYIYIDITSIFYTSISSSCRAVVDGRFGVRIPAATDPSRKNVSDSSTAKHSEIGVSDSGPQR